jgi:hypothetical protein
MPCREVRVQAIGFGEKAMSKAVVVVDVWSMVALVDCTPSSTALLGQGTSKVLVQDCTPAPAVKYRLDHRWGLTVNSLALSWFDVTLERYFLF